MRLVIAEKHSVAQAIGQALGGMENHDGYITAGGSLISWVQAAGCGFKLFGQVAGKKLTDSMVRRLLAGRKVKASGLKSRAGKTFDAYLLIDRIKGVRLDFDGIGRKRG